MDLDLKVQISYETIIDCVRCAKVDGKNLLADTWYMLKNGHFVKVEED